MNKNDPKETEPRPNFVDPFEHLQKRDKPEPPDKPKRSDDNEPAFRNHPFHGPGKNSKWNV